MDENTIIVPEENRFITVLEAPREIEVGAEWRTIEVQDDPTR